MRDITGEAVRHGYTLTDIDRLAHAAAAAAYASAMDYRDRYDAAWHAIAELLYASEERPAPRELKKAGGIGVNELAREENRHHGLDSRRDGRVTGAFERYWWAAASATASHEARIVERTALGQILPVLTGKQRAALDALAIHGNRKAAAAALDLDYPALKRRIQAARGRLLALWNEGETPVKPWRGLHAGPLATHCGRGHEYTPGNTRVRRRRGKNGRPETVRACRACDQAHRERAA